MSDLEVDLQGEYAIVNQVMRLYSDKFAAQGFEHDRVKLEASRVLPMVLSFRFWNKRTLMNMDISFFPAREGLNGAFSIHFEKHVNRMLNVADYLKLHGREDLTKFFRYRDPKTDVRHFADSLLQILIGLFGTDLKPIIEGKTFEETPIDWQGYK
jgi:hypothetical protein